jgi:hypothetical protein
LEIKKAETAGIKNCSQRGTLYSSDTTHKTYDKYYSTADDTMIIIMVVAMTMMIMFAVTIFWYRRSHGR